MFDFVPTIVPADEGGIEMTPNEVAKLLAGIVGMTQAAQAQHYISAKEFKRKPPDYLVQAAEQYYEAVQKYLREEKIK